MVLVHTQSGTRNAFNHFNHGTTGIVFKTNTKNGLAVVGVNGVTVDVAFVFENFCNSYLQFGRRHSHFRFVDHLTVANTGQHVGDRITDTHFVISSLTSWPLSGRECHHA